MISLDTILIKELVKQALVEDIGTGDITTQCLISPDKEISAIYNSRSEGIISGMPLLQIIFDMISSNVKVQTLLKEGQKVKPGQDIAVITGNARAILTGERLSLNFIQKMSAIATLTNQYQEAIKPYMTKITDTRKSTPNFRIFEKYSVIMGGGSLHRFGLYDCILIKDNHIKIAGNIIEAVKSARDNISHTLKIGVETENIEEVKQALKAGADIIMLDNMTLEEMKHSVNLIDKKAVTEASGAITLENVRDIASIGVDYISTSAITAKAGSLDIGLDI